MKKGLIIVLALLLNQSVAQAQYDSTSLKSTVAWVVSTLTHHEVVKLKDGSVYEDIRVQASFDDRTKELILETKDYLDGEPLFYRRTTIPLRLLDEKMKGQIGGEITPKTDQYHYNRKASLLLVTVGENAAITEFHRNVEDKTERTQHTSSCSVRVYYGQLKKDKRLAHKLTATTHGPVFNLPATSAGPPRPVGS
jgi:hypothetical protein